jgi:beta-glucosidase
MKSIIIFIIVAFILQYPAIGQRVVKAQGIEKRVEVLLKKMTLEEKIGQMTQVALDIVSKGEKGTQEPHEIDTAKLEKAVVDYHVGSILNVINSSYKVEHWYEIITAIQDAAKKTRLGIPVLYGIDAVHGANYTTGATLFPQPIAQAATFNTDAVKQIGRITAYEMRASGILWNFYPVLDLGRQPVWPRLWETFGEDVCVATKLGTSYIKGSVSEYNVIPCLKHYVGYGHPMNGQDRTPAWIDERMMREYFLPPFEAAVKAGAPTVMVNSSEVNGIPGHANYHLLTEVLKDEWKFKGFVVSDWRDIKNLYGRDRVAASPKEAVRIAVMAGVDMSMVPDDFSFYDYLLELVREKTVPLSRIDDAVRRILRVKMMTDLFENPYPDKSMKNRFAGPEFTEQNLNIAREVITLLKNQDNILPLKNTARILVTGPTADMLSVLNSGWTITWQGNNEALYPKDKPTVLKSIQAKIGEDRVVYIPATSFSEAIDIQAAVSAAGTADVVLACLGEKAYCETPGNINDLTLDEPQLQLVEALAKTGKPIVLVLAEGRPRIIRRIADKVQGILMAYLPGIEGGTAVADVLFGDVNPSGKLPFSYPRYPNAITPYDCKPLELEGGNSYNPEFPFGFGLSYTTFEYSNLKVNKSVYNKNEPIEVSVNVKNSGPREGKESILLFVNQLYRSISPPVRQLKAFTKISLKPGEEQTVKFSLKADDLSFIGLDMKRITEPGTFRVSIAELSAEFKHK